MALRKEQILFVVTALVAVLVGRQYLEQPTVGTRFAPKTLEFTPTPVAPAPLVADPTQKPVRWDFCTEPSETRPLPPRELPFPPRSDLSVVGLPLEPGPDYRHLWLLRQDGAVVSGVTVQVGGAAGGAAAGGGAVGGAADQAATPAAAAQDPGPSTRKQREEEAARTYDRIYVGGQPGAFFGVIDAEGRDLYALAADGADLDGLTLRMRSYDVDKGRLGEMRVFGNDALKISKIVLAGTLRNEIQRRDRAIPKTPAHLPELRQHIDWLLATARTDARVYDEAQKQAELFRDLAAKEIEGQRVLLTVLRARGDLAAETAMLTALADSGREGAFRFEGLGQIKARLGLNADAEADLRQAVALQPADARPHAALAEFLRQRGRTREAVAAARAADQAIGSVPNAIDQARVRTLIAQSLLAGGDVEGARAQLAGLSADLAQPYLEGCIAYAAGRTADALTAFRAAASTADAGAAQLGQAACLLRSGKWQEAHDLLVTTAEAEPLLRHRALTGLALLWQRLGQNDAALAAVDRALEADPNDSYAHYLRGRSLRLSGQATPALEALRAALRMHDDFVPALAEVAKVQAMAAVDSRGAEQAQAMVAARRYADRAVALVPAPSIELSELQGTYAFYAADPEAASAAFANARALATDDKGQAYSKGGQAIIDYSRGRVEDAVAALQRLTQDLGKEDAVGKWADTKLLDIFDHAEKEALGDSFDRTEVGTIWTTDVDTSALVSVVDGRLHFHGRLATSGKGMISAKRNEAVKRGRSFLAAGVRMQVGKKHARDGFAGLCIEVLRGNDAIDFQAKLGVFEGVPYLSIQDGREAGADVVVRVKLPIANFDGNQPVDLELRVLPRGEGDSKQWLLQTSWNGDVVHRHELKTLSGNTSNELRTLLLATGQNGRTELDVWFDDYRLERRKDVR